MENETQATEEVVATEAKTELTMDEVIQQKVDEQLAKLKGNLDKAYESRDAAMKVSEDLKKSQQEAEIKALEIQGKQTEALELKLKQQDEEMLKLINQNTALTRDAEVKTILATMEFNSDKAAAMAANEISMSLTKVDGKWVGRSGEDVATAVQNYASDESNAFMFKAKISTGATSVPKPGKAIAANPQTTKRLSEMTAAEALEHVKSGALDNDGKNWY